jgi:hypothetical protein
MSVLVMMSNNQLIISYNYRKKSPEYGTNTLVFPRVIYTAFFTQHVTNT